jgi:hypothetical protein
VWSSLPAGRQGADWAAGTALPTGLRRGGGDAAAAARAAAADGAAAARDWGLRDGDLVLVRVRAPPTASVQMTRVSTNVYLIHARRSRKDSKWPLGSCFKTPIWGLCMLATVLVRVRAARRPGAPPYASCLRFAPSPRRTTRVAVA